jgi:hypothetical protein
LVKPSGQTVWSKLSSSQACLLLPTARRGACACLRPNLLWRDRLLTQMPHSCHTDDLLRQLFLDKLHSCLLYTLNIQVLVKAAGQTAWSNNHPHQCVCCCALAPVPAPGPGRPLKQPKLDAVAAVPARQADSTHTKLDDISYSYRNMMPINSDHSNRPNLML